MPENTRAYETVEASEAALWAQADAYRGEDTEVIDQVDDQDIARAPRRSKRTSKRAVTPSAGRTSALISASLLFLSATLGPALAIGVVIFAHRALHRGINPGRGRFLTRAILVAGWFTLAGWACQIAFNAYFFGTA